MPKIIDGLTRVATQSKPVVTDFDGNDAMSADPIKLKQQIQRFATASLPEALRKCLIIIQTSKSNRDVIEAAKFIKSISDGQVAKQKTVNAIVKKFTNQELNTSLQGQDE